jgi:hypothetical protein
MSINVLGTEGYAEHAEVLASAWRGISFEDHHRPVLHLIPDAPSRILDVGAGMGRDAAALAAMGHAVLAVEPVGPLLGTCIPVPALSGSTTACPISASSAKGRTGSTSSWLPRHGCTSTKSNVAEACAQSMTS